MANRIAPLRRYPKAVRNFSSQASEVALPAISKLTKPYANDQRAACRSPVLTTVRCLPALDLRFVATVLAITLRASGWPIASATWATTAAVGCGLRSLPEAVEDQATWRGLALLKEV